MHGQAATTDAMIGYMKTQLRLSVVNISPGSATGFFAHLVKSCRVLLSLFVLLLGRFTVRRGVLYLAADGGLGIAYNIAIAAVARICGYRIYVHHHSFAYVNRYSKLMALLGRVMGPNASHIVLCQAQACGLRRRYAQMAHVPMVELSSAAFIEPVPFLPRGPRRNLRLGFLSNLIVEKGLDTCIALLREAKRQGLPVTLTLAGKAPDQRAADIVRKAQREFGDALTYLGPVSEQQKTDFFNAIDIFVFPTRYINEAQPRAIIEALSFGVPVATIARSCITADVGRDGGICVSPDEDFVAGILSQLRGWLDEAKTWDARRRLAAGRAVELHALGIKQLQALIGSFD